MLLRAVATMDPTPSVEVIGDGPERTALEALAGALGIAHAVTFAGELPHDRTLGRIAAGRIFCLPCRLAEDGDRDAMPTVIIEAMMRGVPVVSTDVVGIPEMVDDTCGRLVAPEDAEGIRAALEELLGDDEVRTGLGRNGAARARERFSVERQVDGLLQRFDAVTR